MKRFFFITSLPFNYFWSIKSSVYTLLEKAIKILLKEENSLKYQYPFSIKHLAEEMNSQLDVARNYCNKNDDPFKISFESFINNCFIVTP